MEFSLFQTLRMSRAGIDGAKVVPLRGTRGRAAGPSIRRSRSAPPTARLWLFSPTSGKPVWLSTVDQLQEWVSDEVRSARAQVRHEMEEECALRPGWQKLQDRETADLRQHKSPCAIGEAQHTCFCRIISFVAIYALLDVPFSAIDCDDDDDVIS